MKNEFITKDQMYKAVSGWCNLDEYYHGKKPTHIPVAVIKSLIDNIEPVNENKLLTLIVNNHTVGGIKHENTIR